MILEELERRARIWARDRRLFDPRAQLLKTREELCELERALVANDDPAIIEELGDALITLIVFARAYQEQSCKTTSITDALAVAVPKIEQRSGETINGVFVKESDL